MRAASAKAAGKSSDAAVNAAKANLANGVENAIQKLLGLVGVDRLPPTLDDPPPAAAAEEPPTAPEWLGAAGPAAHELPTQWHASEPGEVVTLSACVDVSAGDSGVAVPRELAKAVPATQLLAPPMPKAGLKEPLDTATNIPGPTLAPKLPAAQIKQPIAQTKQSVVQVKQVAAPASSAPVSAAGQPTPLEMLAAAASRESTSSRAAKARPASGYARASMLNRAADVGRGQAPQVAAGEEAYVPEELVGLVPAPTTAVGTEQLVAPPSAPTVDPAATTGSTASAITADSSPAAGADEERVTIFVGNVPIGTAIGLVRAECVKYGKITSVEKKKEPWDPLIGGWARVVYAAPEMAATAVARMSRKTSLFGSTGPLDVRLATAEDLEEPGCTEAAAKKAKGEPGKASKDAAPTASDAAAQPSAAPAAAPTPQDDTPEQPSRPARRGAGRGADGGRGGYRDRNADLRSRSRPPRQNGPGRPPARRGDSRERAGAGPAKVRRRHSPPRGGGRARDSRSPYPRNGGGPPRRGRGERGAVEEPRRREPRRREEARREEAPSLEQALRAPSSSSSSSSSPPRQLARRSGPGFSGFDVSTSLTDKASGPLTGGKQVSVRGDWARMEINETTHYYRNLKTGETQAAMPQGFVTPAFPTDPRANVGKTKLFVARVPPIWDEPTLAQHFQPFGTVVSATLQRDSTGNPMGSAFVQYSNEGEAAAAMNGMQGFYVAGIFLKVTPSRY